MEFKEFKKKYHILLNSQQEQAVLNTDGAILLLAVPGSGKTTVIVTRIGYLMKVKQIAPEEILTLTYSVAATKDMQLRFQSIFGEEETPTFRTIHSFCMYILKEYEKKKRTKLFTMIPNQNEVVNNLYHEITGEYGNTTLIKDIIVKLGYAKNRMLTKEEIQKIKIENISLLKIQQAYENYKIQHQQMDFDDQLQYAYQILQQESEILHTFKRKYRYIHIDEAQDTSKLQHEIISLLVEKNIFMVGDEDQSIYQFRAAYPQALLEFSKRYPKAQTLLMEHNYRSTPEILNLANHFIKQNENRIEKNIVANYPKGKLVKWLNFNTIEEQYDYVMDQAKKTRKILAILYRNNTSCIPIVERLEHKKTPYVLRGQDTEFFCDKIVHDIKDFIIFSKDMQDITLFRKLYYKLNCGISKEMVNKIETVEKGETIFDILLQQALPTWQSGKIVNIKRNFRMLRNKNSFDSIKSILEDLGYQEYLDSKAFDALGKNAYQQKITVLLAIAKKNKKIENFFKELSILEEKIKQGSNSKDAKVILSTIHASKGLEYEKVILIDMIKTILPSVKKPEKEDTIKRKEQKELYEEEVRLCYVGMTRAKKELELVSYQKDYQKKIECSEFIEQIFTQKGG